MVLVQTGRTFQQRKPNAAEEEIASFLNRLPEEKYKAFREFSIDAQISESMKGFRKKRPDFIVVGPDIGIVAIEVKNWNILRNQYRWIDQETVEILVPGQPAEPADNPERQRDAYERALIDLVGQKFDIYVDALLAFPTCSRTDFLNKLSEPLAVACPGSKYLFNLSKMLFREDIERYRSSPEELLHKVVRADRRSRGCTPAQVAMAWTSSCLKNFVSAAWTILRRSAANSVASRRNRSPGCSIRKRDDTQECLAGHRWQRQD